MSLIVTPSHTCGPLFGFAILYDGLDKSVEASDQDAIFLSGEIRDEKIHLGYEGFVEFFAPHQSVRVRTHEGRYEAILKRPQAVTLANGALQAPHFDVMIHARGVVRHLRTRAYLPNEAFATDPVVELVAPAHREKLLMKAGRDPRHFSFDITLRGLEESVFFDI